MQVDRIFYLMEYKKRFVGRDESCPGECEASDFVMRIENV